MAENNIQNNDPGKNKKKSTIIIVVSIISAIVIIGLVVFFAFNCGKQNNTQPTAASETVEEIKTQGLTGAVMELNEKEIIITSGSLTAVFDIDESTIMPKDLAVGDIADVTYYGDLFEEPYAISVEIITPKAVTDKEISGQVSQKTDTTVKIAVASSTGYIFTTNKDTKITGKADTVNVGDEVSVKYTGTLGKSPVATNIDILKLGENSKHKRINVTVTKVNKDNFTAKSDKKEYTFYTTNKTKYTGGKFEAGCEATIRYTGELDKKPEADFIYVTKKAPVKPTTKPTAKPTAKPTTSPTAEPTEPVPTKETETPEDNYITEDGILLSWNDNSCKIKTRDHGELKLTFSENLDIAAGYFPQEYDVVHITFGKNTLVLTEIQLLARSIMAGEANVVSWSDKECTLKISDEYAEIFKEQFPDYKLDDNQFKASISPEAEIPSSFKPEQGDDIIYAVIDNTKELVLIFAQPAE